MRRLLVLLLVMFVFVQAADAQKRKKKRAKKAAKQTEKTETKKPKKESETVAENKTEPDKAVTEANQADQPLPGTNDEMEAFRAIQNRTEARVQDLADLLLMYRGEFGKYATSAKRLARARELGLIQDHKGEEKLDRGTLAYAIMKIYSPERGLLYWLTGWERYALRDVQEAGIMPARNTPGQNLSGEQLMGTMTTAEEFAASRLEWRKK